MGWIRKELITSHQWTIAWLSFCVAPFVGYKAASVRIGMHIFAKLTKQSSYKSTHLAMLERDDKKEQPPDKLFLWHFIKLLPIFINNFYIFFQKNVEEGWVGDCFWGTIGFFLRGREGQEGNSRRSIVFARQAPRWQQHLSLVHSQLSQNTYWLCCHCWVINMCSAQ